MTRRILITGATGNQGGAAARSLIDGGVPVRVAGTRAEVLGGAFPEAEAVRLDLNDPRSFGAALEGVSGVFLVRPPKIAKVGSTLNAFLDHAQRAGVQHVVFSSVAGAEHHKHIPHRKVELHLQAGDLPWTILRPGFFAQNFGDAYRFDIAQDDRVYVPAGAGRAAFIDTRDVGELAAQILSAPGRHVGQAYWLTGPESLSFAEAAAILSAELGRPIRYEPASALGYLRHLRRRQHLGWMQSVIQTVLHVGLRRGDAEAVSPQLEELLGRKPRSLRDYFVDHEARWARASAEPRAGA